MQISNWINKIKSKKPYFNRKKPKKKVSIKEKKGMVYLYCFKNEASSFIC